MAFRIEKQIPTELGYSMPAEWERHSATWLSWPRPEGISFPDAYELIVPALVSLVEGISRSEKVHINVGNSDFEKTVRGFLGKVAESSRVNFFHIPINEPWCRDHGPIFVTRQGSEPLAVIDWGYNAWGGKYPPFDKDDVVPTRVAQELKLPLFEQPMILEGGSIDINGKGTLLTTESCLLNPNRNPNLSKSQIEEHLKKYLGVSHILWLGDGIVGDDTDGHVDDLTRFINQDTVVTVVESDPQDENFHALQDNLKRLKTMKLENGKPLNIIELPMPAAVVKEDMRLPASYANFYLSNGAVLLPVFGDPNDKKAMEIIGRCFPTREVIAINCRELVWGLGTFHCLTQQQPESPVF